jgi:hypothetical protein
MWPNPLCLVYPRASRRAEPTGAPAKNTTSNSKFAYDDDVFKTAHAQLLTALT